MIANVNNRRSARVFLCCLLEDFDMKLYVEQETLYFSKREHCTIRIHNLCHNCDDFTATFCKTKLICIIDSSMHAARQNFPFQK